MVTQEELQNLAKNGDPDALYQLGQKYFEEAAESKNYALYSNAEYLLDRAAKQGHTKAMFALALLHGTPSGTFSDAKPQAALDLLEKLIQKNPDDYMAKATLGMMYCTAGEMYTIMGAHEVRAKGYIMPDGSKMERNVHKGQELIEDVIQNAFPNNLNIYTVTMLCNIYTGGWLRDTCTPTIDDTIVASKLCNKTIELAIIENEQTILDSAKQRFNYLTKKLVTMVNSLKSTENESFDEESFLDKLKKNGLEDIANGFQQKLKEEQERIKKEKEQQTRISELKRIRENNSKYKGYISLGFSHMIGLRADGTVVATGSNSSGQCNIDRWQNIIAVSAGSFHTVGLKADRTVVATGSNSTFIPATGGYNSTVNYAAGRTFYFNQCKVGDWQNIVAVAAGGDHTVGLMSDGTVIAKGCNTSGQCNVDNWRNITAIAANYNVTIGLRADGTVIATGDNKRGQCNVGSWRDIVAISEGDGNFTVGLRADGTVIAIGKNDYGQCNVGSWRDIVAIDTDHCHTVGLRADGTVVATGSKISDEYKVGSWRDIGSVDKNKFLQGLSSGVFCTNCGTPAKSGANFCTKCGKKL